MRLTIIASFLSNTLPPVIPTAGDDFPQEVVNIRREQRRHRAIGRGSSARQVHSLLIRTSRTSYVTAAFQLVFRRRLEKEDACHQPPASSGGTP